MRALPTPPPLPLVEGVTNEVMRRDPVLVPAVHHSGLEATDEILIGLNKLAGIKEGSFLVGEGVTSSIQLLSQNVLNPSLKNDVNCMAASAMGVMAGCGGVIKSAVLAVPHTIAAAVGFSKATGDSLAEDGAARGRELAGNGGALVGGTIGRIAGTAAGGATGMAAGVGANLLSVTDSIGKTVSSAVAFTGIGAKLCLVDCPVVCVKCVCCGVDPK